MFGLALFCLFFTMFSVYDKKKVKKLLNLCQKRFLLFSRVKREFLNNTGG